MSISMNDKNQINQNQINWCPDNCHREKCPPLDDCTWNFVLDESCSPENCSLDDCSLARIIALRTVASQKIVLKILAPGKLPPG